MPHNGSCIVAPTNTDVSVKGKRDYISLHTACAPKSDAVLRLKAGDKAPSVFITPGLGGDIAGLLSIYKPHPNSPRHIWHTAE